MKLDLNDKEIYGEDEEFAPKERKHKKLHKMKRNYKQ